MTTALIAAGDAQPLSTRDAARLLHTVVEQWIDGDDVLAVIAAVDDVLDAAGALTHVQTDDDYCAALAHVQQIKAQRTGLRECFDQVREPANRVWKRVVEAHKQYDEPAAREEHRLKTMATAWQADRDRERREAEALAREEHAANERAEREALARAAEHQGATAEAEDIRTAPSTAAPVHIPRAAYVPPIKGVSTREHWRGEIVDLLEFVKGIAAGDTPLPAALGIAEVKGSEGQLTNAFLNQSARAQRSEMQYRGARAYVVRSVAVGRAGGS